MPAKKIYMLIVSFCFILFMELNAEDKSHSSALISLPMDTVAINEKWDLGDGASAYSTELVDDELLGIKVLEVKRIPKADQKIKSSSFKSKSSVSGSYAVEAWLRFPQLILDSKGAPATRAVTKAVLSCGKSSTEDVPAFVMEAGSAAEQFSWTGKIGSKDAVKGTISPAMKIADVSPFSPEAFRLETEACVAELSPPQNTWILLRIETRPDSIRMYFNGLLVMESANPGTAEGPVEISFLRDDVRVAKLEVKKLDDAPTPFEKIPLDYRVNSQGPADLSSLELKGDSMTVNGIPFQPLSGISSKDHVDVGASIFRYRMATRYAAEIDPQNHVLPPSEFDPSRLRLSVPQRAYSRAWILAASNDNPSCAPILTLRFYRPKTDWATDAAVNVPSFTSGTGGKNDKAVKIKSKDGKDLNLWLIPVELNTADITGNFRTPLLYIELTKEIKPNVAYPDPCNYSYQPAGLRSSVQLYGLTLEEAPVCATAGPDVKGGVYVSPEIPNWQVSLRNQTASDLPVEVKLSVIDPYGKAVPSDRKITLKSGEEQTVSFQIKPELNGLHTVKTTVSAANWSQTRDGTFLMVPKFSRKATPLNSPWGLWTWAGTHDTIADLEVNARLLKALGAINQFDLEETVDAKKKTTRNLDELRAKWGLGPTHFRLVPRNVPEWSTKNPIKPEDYDAYKEQKGKEAKAILDEHPDFQYVNCFAENAVSLRLTHGIPPWALGQPWFTYDEKEKQRLREMLTTANAAAEGVKKYAPKIKFLFGHAAANFAPPFFREKDWNPDLFAGFGMDLPQFERMPERQPRATEPSLLYFLQKELKERGMQDKEIVHLESYFPSSHELALGLRGQANSVVRTAVLSMALGTTKFMHTWCLQDCASRWGSSHYSGSAMIGREPEAYPKPSAAAYATMTRVLDLAKFDGWLDTGSKSTFCLRFKDDDRLIYPVWTYHGSRPMEINADSDKVKLVKIDESGNEFPINLENGKASVTLTPTVFWIIAANGGIKSVKAGAPSITDAPSPGCKQIVLDDFEKVNWTYDPNPYKLYAENNWDMTREPVKMTQECIKSDERGSNVWRVSMAERPSGKPCVGFYGVFTPSKPITISGKAKALGIYGKGKSQWFRFIYEVVDAKGETWLSCGQRNAWNSDDIHSWSYFNHDGWRYMEFPLPVTSPGDNYREKSCYSWGSTDEGIVDLPLKLTKIIIEMRTDIIYVNDMLPVDELSIELDNLVALYDNPDDITEKPVKLQELTREDWRPKMKESILPNPIKALKEKGAGEPAVIEKVYPPDVMDSGDQVYVKIKPVDGAQKYTVYVSATEDGTGARAAPAKVDKEASLLFVRGLQPAIPMYFFATYTDKDGKESKPSEVRKTVLRDEFPFK